MKALVPIANGSEEMEAVIIIDTLRRAEWDVTVAGLTPGTIEASRGVKLVPDTPWDQINPDDFDIILLPGGFGGTEAFMAHAGVQQTLRDFNAQGKWIGSICAAALALNEVGILQGRLLRCRKTITHQLNRDLVPSMRQHRFALHHWSRCRHINSRGRTQSLCR